LLAKADEAHAASPGTAGGKAFDDLRDLDDLIASVFEVLTPTGKYYWVPINRVRVLEFRAPECTRDLLWRPARMAVEDGPDGEVYLPALYISSHASPDDRVRLGRVTEWQGGDGTPVRGLGQRMFLVGEDAQGIGDLGSLEFTTAGTAK
jgi:type VI secretion system protein ImpE